MDRNGLKQLLLAAGNKVQMLQSQMRPLALQIVILCIGNIKILISPALKHV